MMLRCASFLNLCCSSMLRDDTDARGSIEVRSPRSFLFDAMLDGLYAP
jgi:hypothetical protein